MKKLLTTLVILTGLLGSGGAVWADAQSDAVKGYAAYKAGDYAEAVKWYRKAAEQGNAIAQFSLGNKYLNGEGVSQDYAEAVKWYRKAAEQGYARAHLNLGWMYYDGRGVTQDYAEAAKWYRKAAEQGHAKAQFNLGFMYDEGTGVTQDYAEALKWYRKAAEQGNAIAQKKVDRLAPLTTTGDTVPLASEMQRKANATCATVTKRGSYKFAPIKTNFVVNSVTQGLNNWVSATMTGQGYIDNFYYNTKTHTSICGSDTFRERGFDFIRK
jgi:TPR repeat protein